MKKEYRLRRAWKFFFITYVAVFTYAFYLIIPFFSLGERELDSFPLSIGVVVLLVYLYYLSTGIYRGIFERVVLSSHGIEYHTFGFSIFADWTTGIKAGDYQMKLYKLNGVFVDEAGSKLRIWFPSMIRMKTFIPLSLFDKNWHNSELGKQVKQYAPHLFEKEKSA